MAEALCTDPIALRTCILYNMTEGMEVFDGYKRFCKVLGDDLMDYNEYEYWFMRFAQGKLDLEHDRSQDPPTATFEDLTPEILRYVISHLTLTEIAILSQVSHDLCDVTKTAPIRHQEAVVKIIGDSLSLEIDKKVFVSKRVPNEKSPFLRAYNDCFETSKIMKANMKLLTEGIAGMEKFLLHPRLKFEKKFELHVGIFGHKYNTDYNKKLKEMVIKFIGGIAKHVTSVTIESERFMHDYLVLFTPGKLEEINFNDSYIHPKEVAHTEQYKQIKRLVVTNEDEVIPFKLLNHLECFDIKAKPNGSKFKLKQLEDAIFRGEFPNFKKCNHHSFDPEVYNIRRWARTFGPFVESEKYIHDFSIQVQIAHQRQNGMTLKMTVFDDEDDPWWRRGRTVEIEKIN